MYLKCLIHRLLVNVEFENVVNYQYKDGYATKWVISIDRGQIKLTLFV